MDKLDFSSCMLPHNFSLVHFALASLACVADPRCKRLTVVRHTLLAMNNDLDWQVIMMHYI